MLPLRRSLPWQDRVAVAKRFDDALSCLAPSHFAGIASPASALSTSHGRGSGAEEEEPAYADVPTPRRRWERKPYPTPVKELIRRAKEERRSRLANPCRVLESPPANGLLVPHLIPVARRVHFAWQSFLCGLARLLDHPSFRTAVHRCQFCEEVHIGRRGGHGIRSCDGPGSAARGAAHVWVSGGIRDIARLPDCYHLHDRVGTPRVGHKERHLVPRLPAVVELCVQAGLDLEEYPAKRRTKPVYSIEGRIVDFETGAEGDDVALAGEATSQPPIRPRDGGDGEGKEWEGEGGGGEQLRKLAARTLESWLEMRAGAERLMESYPVQTCGYCPEVQVGPKGHKVRMCRAAGHQFRAGLHAWQEATVDDLLGPSYVWHESDPGSSPPANELRKYYGKAPGVVELCVQAGALVPFRFRSMMRLDVALPGLDERDLVA